MKKQTADETGWTTRFAQAIQAGKKRDYRKAVAILEALAAEGYAESGHPELFLYLARSWHALHMYSRSAVCARSYIRLCPSDGAGWFFFGRSLLSEGIVDRAVYALRRSIECNPASIDARTLLGLALFRARRPVAARVVFEEALSLSPDDPRLNQGYLNALFIEAVQAYKRGDAEFARQRLTFVINNDIDGVVPRMYLAHALRDLGYLPEALSQYEAAIEFAPDDEVLRWYPLSILLEMGEGEWAAELMAELDAPSSVGSPEAVNLFILKNHVEKGEWSQVVRAARSFLRTNGSDPQIHSIMGEAQRNAGNTEGAINHFSRALELDPDNPGPWYGILMVFLSARDWKGLDAMLNRASRAGCEEQVIRYYRVIAQANLDRDPQQLLPLVQEEVRVHGAVPDLLLALARTYFRIGLPDLAAPWYRKVVSLDEKSEDAYLGLIACAEESGIADDLQEAYRAYLAHWPDNSSIRHEYMRVLERCGKWSAAADEAETLSALDPQAVPLRHIALWRRKAGEFRSAAVLYRSMLRSAHEDRVLLANLVYCLDRMGERESARKLLHEANRVLPPDADALLIEGKLLAASGDWKGALEMYRKTVDLFPKHVRAWEEVAAVYEQQNVVEMAVMFRQKANDLKKTGQRKGPRKAAPEKS